MLDDIGLQEAHETKPVVSILGGGIADVPSMDVSYSIALNTLLEVLLVSLGPFLVLPIRYGSGSLNMSEGN
jgi:hypothetical protein